MSAEHDIGFWEQAFKWAWAVIGGLLMVIWGMLNAKINGKASKESVESLSEEMQRRRDIEAKLFDELKLVRQEINDKHLDIINTIHSKFPARQ